MESSTVQSDRPGLFKPFQKIARFNRDVVATEKIDGMNGLIFIADDFETMKVGSRSRWITPEQDCKGFARWAEENKDGLLKLGPGYHYGEWWGAGIGRRYGLSEKRFSLFNVARWTDDVRPACCSVVPTLGTGALQPTLEAALHKLRTEGSLAAPGFMKPEGVVIYHTAARQLFKVTLENDASPKGAAVDE